MYYSEEYSGYHTSGEYCHIRFGCSSDQWRSSKHVFIRYSALIHFCRFDKQEDPNAGVREKTVCLLDHKLTLNSFFFFKGFPCFTPECPRWWKFMVYCMYVSFTLLLKFNFKGSTLLSRCMAKQRYPLYTWLMWRKEKDLFLWTFQELPKIQNDPRLKFAIALFCILPWHFVW